MQGEHSPQKQHSTVVEYMYTIYILITNVDKVEENKTWSARKLKNKIYSCQRPIQTVYWAAFAKRDQVCLADKLGLERWLAVCLLLWLHTRMHSLICTEV